VNFNEQSDSAQYALTANSSSPKDPLPVVRIDQLGPSRYRPRFCDVTFLHWGSRAPNVSSMRAGPEIFKFPSDPRAFKIWDCEVHKSLNKS